ncbi:xanthine dehydrogenase family protein molybdopterin-binding subunit [Aeromicrobium phragmitis]|uniref:xanthine dehydrogenase family protein molybdopterin-binding subunit n=1 Tax=Aeromicrobium phragmitis TaxID=2478914 RepID=UPI00105BEA6C|nr:xanthine dehydrogenase family protein molybdopterin-binding subunit [Aeromicrobium phragmitis]
MSSPPATRQRRRRSQPSQASPADQTQTWARREDIRLTTGTGTFVGDVDLDGQLWARVVRSAVAHGVLVDIDVTSAAEMPGVVRVLTAKDLADVPQIPLRILSRPELNEFLQPVLASERVRYVGEPVAIVVAESARAAEDAAERVVVQVDELVPAMAVDEDHVDAVWPDATRDAMCVFTGRDGEPDAVFESADVVVAASFTTGRDTGLPLETRGLVAQWLGDELHLWGPTKFICFTRATVARWFDLPEDQVICHHVDVGGMFGSRGEVYPEDYLVPWASAVTGRPVKWIEDRNEHLVSINHSRGQTHRISIAARADGTLLGLRDEALVDMGAYARPIGGRVAELTVESLPGPYRWPALDVICTAVATNRTPVGTMRGPATFDTTFARERLLDILADELEMDPVELRRRNLIGADEIPYVQDFGAGTHPSVYDSGDYHLVLDRFLADLDYEALLEEVGQRRAEGESVGVGFAFFLDHSGLGREETVQLRLTADGRFVFYTTSSEIGQGLASMIITVAAEALGVSPDLIDVVANQSGEFDGGNGSFSSRGTIFVGSATQDAAFQLRSMLAKEGPQANPADADAWRALGPRTVIGRHTNDGPTYGFGAAAAVVSVEPETLDIVVERLGVAYDCGRVIDRPSAMGQLVGAAVQGLGGTLLQELTFDPDGQPQSTTFMDFQPPTVTEVPRVEATLLELGGTTSNPLGVKGIGEAGIMGVGGSISNALSAALSTTRAITRLPIRPDDVVPFAPPLPAAGNQLRSSFERRRPSEPASRDVTGAPGPSSRSWLVILAAGALGVALAARALRRKLAAKGHHG